MSDSQVFPLAEGGFSDEILQLLSSANQYHQVKRGANEVTKSLNRGTAEIVVLAADTTPLEVILHLPLLCEDKATPYIYVPSRTMLGRSVGVSRSVIAACITSNEGSTIAPMIQNIRDKVERAAV